MFSAKKLILIIAALLWLITPCFADSAHHHKTTSKKHVAKHSTHKNKKYAKSSKHVVKKIKTALRKQKNSLGPSTVEHIPALMRTTTALEETAPPPKPPGFVASIEERLVNFVHKSVATLRYSAYKLGGSHFDTSHGIYIVDCSGYVDHTLHAVFPNAYLSLVNSSGTEKPNSLHYYDFFKSLSYDPDDYWSSVEEIEQLRPGDILVFRYKTAQRLGTRGHVMVVMNKPVRDNDAYLVSVADSAPSGHSLDTRPPKVSGIGVGTLLLKVNPKTGEPSAYAWKVGARWKNNVNIAMARPLEFES